MKNFTLDRSKLTKPLCPHCGTEMCISGLQWENSDCSCWWKGCQDAVYTHQVRRDLSDDELRLAADDLGAVEAYLTERRKSAAAQKIDREFAAALAYEKANVEFLAASDVETRTRIITDHLYAYDAVERWTILNKSGKGIRKLIRRWLADFYAGEDLEQSITTVKAWRHLQTNGTDPFAAQKS